MLEVVQPIAGNTDQHAASTNAQTNPPPIAPPIAESIVPAIAPPIATKIAGADEQSARPPNTPSPKLPTNEKSAKENSAEEKAETSGGSSRLQSRAPSKLPVKRIDSAALTKDDYGDWEEVLANIPQNLTEDQLENIAWDQIESDQAAHEPFGIPAIDSTSHVKPSEATGDFQSSKLDSASQQPAGGLASDSFTLEALPPELALPDPEDIPDQTYRGDNVIPLPGQMPSASGELGQLQAGKATRSANQSNKSRKDASAKATAAGPSSKKKQFAIVGAIAVASSVTAGVGFWVFLNLVSKPKQVASNVVIADEGASANNSPAATGPTNNESDAQSGGLATGDLVNNEDSQTNDASENPTGENSGQNPAAPSNELNAVSTTDNSADASGLGSPNAGQNLSTGEDELGSELPSIFLLPGEESRSIQSLDPVTGKPRTNSAAQTDQQSQSTDPSQISQPNDLNGSNPNATIASVPGQGSDNGSAATTVDSAVNGVNGNASSSTTDPALDESQISERLPDIFGPNGFGQLLTPQMNIGDAVISGDSSFNELDIEQLQEEGFIVAHPDPQQVPLWKDRASTVSVGRIRFTNQSLVSCMDLFSKTTGIGITVDWPSIRSSGKSEWTPITADLQNQTLEEIIKSLLDQNDLMIDIPGDGLPLVRPKTLAKNDESSIIWDLDSLFEASQPDGTVLTQFSNTNISTESPKPADATFVNTKVADALSSGENTQTTPTSKPTQTLAEQLVALWGIESQCFVEGNKLRWEPNAAPLAKASVWTTMKLLKRMLAEQSNSNAAPTDGELTWQGPNTEPQMLFDPEDWHRNQQVLTRTVSPDLHLPESRPVSDILGVAAKALNVQLLIDWQSVWQHGLVPTQTDIAILRNRSLAQLTKKYKDQYSLQLVNIGLDQFMLTTPEARKTRYIVVPVRLPEGGSIDELKRSLYLLAPANFEGRTMFKVVPVPGSADLFLARITLPTLEQLDDVELHVAFGWKLNSSDDSDNSAPAKAEAE